MRKKAAVRKLGDEIKKIEDELEATQKELESHSLTLPNIPHETVPEGQGEDDNVEFKTWGTPAKMSFKPKDHVDLGESLGILDFERGAKLSGARFVVYRGAGAALERALAQLMLDIQNP